MGEYEAHSKRMRTAICQAMIRLLEEKAFTKITVRDIMEAAEIQRATFYRYFRDKYEVAEEINRSLADFLTKNFFSAFYLGKGVDPKAQRVFDSQYRRVLNKMMRLQIENVDLRKNLNDAFQRDYRLHYPDCTDYEAYLAAENFLSVAAWLTLRDVPLTEIKSSFLSDTQLRWLARYYNVDPDGLAEYINQNKLPPTE